MSNRSRVGFSRAATWARIGSILLSIAFTWLSYRSVTAGGASGKSFLTLGKKTATIR